MKDNACVGTRAAVLQFIEENRLLQKGDKALVALSGGTDSVALLHILISVKNEYQLTIGAAHFHHGIRGEEADRDERFSAALCERWDVPFYHDKADVPAVSRELHESLELCGRRLRYRFLADTAEKYGFSKIVTAHHGDDNAETVLWNLTRGAGIGGLRGIPAQREKLIRPLLCLSRDAIEAYCRDNQLDYVTDSSNLSDDCTRNILRHRVMPVLRELNPRVEEHIAGNAVLMAQADDYFKDISAEELYKAKIPYGFSCEKLLKLHPIVLDYAVKSLLEDAGAPVDHCHVMLVIDAMRGGRAVDLGHGFSVSCAQGILRVIGSDSAADNEFCVPFAEYIKTHGTRVTIKNGKPDLKAAGLSDTAENSKIIHNLLSNHGIPCDIITPDTVVRSRRAGDTFTDARRGVTKTLKKLLNERRIPREQRGGVLVVAEGSTVLWLSVCGISAQVKAEGTRDGDYIIMQGVESCIRI